MENNAGNSKLVFCVQDDANQQRAQDILRRIAGIFNKCEDDFPSLNEYNDYLEDAMDMTTKLIQGKDVNAIEEKIHKYQNENKELIKLRSDQKREQVFGSNEGPAHVLTETNVGNEEPPRGADHGEGNDQVLPPSSTN